MVARSWVGETNVVARGLPFTWTTEFPAKLLPVAVSVNAGPPAPAVAGLMPVSVGAGGGAVTPRLAVFEAHCPPTQFGGLATCTPTLPGEAMSAASTAMLTCVAETNVSVREAPPTVAVAPDAKPVPVSVRANPLDPAPTLDGLSPVMFGVGLMFSTATAALRAITV